MPNFGPYNPFSPSHVTNSPCSPYNLQIPEMGNFGNMPAPIFNNPPTPGGYPSPLSPLAVLGAWVPSPPARAAPFVYPHPPHPHPPHGHPQNMFKHQHQQWTPMSGSGDMGPLQQMMMPPYQQMQEGRPTTLSQMLNSSSQASSGYQSNFTGSCVSLDTQNISGGEAVTSPSVSPISKALSPADHHDSADTLAHCTVNELANIMAELPLSERRAPGCEKKTLEALKMSPLRSDYRAMKAEANKAMRARIGPGGRVPTPRWAGHYFSHTSPAAMTLPEQENPGTPEKSWNRSELVRPNIVETSPQQPSKLCRYQQLYDLLRDVGLHKYIEMFKKHELDMSTFASLNEADLAEIGVSAFGARRKMLLLIAELQKQRGSYNSPAPAERKVQHTSPPYNTAALNKW